MGQVPKFILKNNKELKHNQKMKFVEPNEDTLQEISKGTNDMLMRSFWISKKRNIGVERAGVNESHIYRFDTRIDHI